MNPSTHSLTSHTFHGLEPGPRLIVLGAVHGNEIGGTRGIERVLDELARGDLIIACPQPLRGNRAYYLVTPALAPDAQPAPALRVFSSWLQQRAREHRPA